MKARILFLLIVFLAFIPGSFTMYGQNEKPKNDVVAGIPVNYDEALTGVYEIPDPLLMLNGEKVKDKKTWYEKRRPEILRLFEESQFGRCPEPPKEMTFNVFDKGTPSLDGKAIRKQVTIYFTKDTTDHKMDLLIYFPVDQNGPVPVFLSINFFPNSMLTDDAGVKEGLMWGKGLKKVAAPRGKKEGRESIYKFISQGIAYAAVYYGDIEPDFAAGISLGVRGYYLKPGTTYPAADEWGAISAWSWGLSRAMDYLEKDTQADSKKVAVFGISRLGKTALWTGARDERFGMTIASCSGEGGAALSRRNYGETIKHMVDTTRFFYQFCLNRRKYVDDPSKAPVEANMLIALVAPRPLLLQTGDTDNWSDSKGEFLSAVAAETTYNLLGKKGVGTSIMPAAGQPILNDLGYYMHAGGHGTVPDDYDIFVKYMKKYFFK